MFDRAWAENLQTIENEFWDNVTAFFYHQSGKAYEEIESLNSELPFQSKKVAEGQNLISNIIRNIDDVWFEPKTAERLKKRLLGLVQYAMTSAWFDTKAG